MIHVLFDIDETMIATQKGLNAKASELMFKKVFNVDTNEETVDNISKTESWIIKAVLDKVGIKIDRVPDVAYKVWAEETSKILQVNKPEILHGIIEVLERLSKNRNIKLSLLTGNSPWRADAKIHHVDLCKYFIKSENHKLEGVFGDLSDERSDLIKIYKTRINKEEKIIVIDDSLIGAIMAKEQNIPIISVATGKIPKPELQKYSKYVFDDFGNGRWQKVISTIEALS